MHLLPFTAAENFSAPPVIVLTVNVNWIKKSYGSKERLDGVTGNEEVESGRTSERFARVKCGNARLCRLPYRHALRFQVMPSLVHLVQAPLQHNGVILTGQRAQQLSSCAVQGRVHVAVRLDFRLEIL